MPAPVFNAVTLEMLWTRLISITDEAAAALVRTSFSTVVRESNDFACVLTDGDGLSLAQATDSIPSFIGTVPRTITHFLKEYPHSALKPGDILITNDIWLGRVICRTSLSQNRFFISARSLDSRVRSRIHRTSADAFARPMRATYTRKACRFRS